MRCTHKEKLKQKLFSQTFNSFIYIQREFDGQNAMLWYPYDYAIFEGTIYPKRAYGLKNTLHFEGT